MAFQDPDFSFGTDSVSPSRLLLDPPFPVPPSTDHSRNNRINGNPLSPTLPRIDADIVNLSRPSSPPPSARRFLFFTIRGLPPYSVNDPRSPNLESITKIRPVDWCDSFTLCSHFDIESDETKFLLFNSSFSDLRNQEDLLVWLATKCRSFPIAFLGSSRSRRPMIIHNLMINPGSGSFSNSQTKFLALNHMSFAASPMLIEPDDWDSLLPTNTFSNVPTLTQIISYCVSAIPNADTTSRYGFLFNCKKI